MNSLVVSNQPAYRHDATPSDDVGHTTPVWVQGAPRETLALSRIEHELIQAFSAIEAVNALYAEHDDDNVLMVFVVVAEHEDAVYNQVINAEHRIRERIDDDFELRVRAHQGRNPVRAVPIRSLPLFLR